MPFSAQLLIFCHRGGPHFLIKYSPVYIKPKLELYFSGPCGILPYKLLYSIKYLFLLPIVQIVGVQRFYHLTMGSWWPCEVV